MKVFNFTGHDVTFRDGQGVDHVFPAKGKIVVNMKQDYSGTVEVSADSGDLKIDVYHRYPGVAIFPEIDYNVVGSFVIVSSMVLDSLKSYGIPCEKTRERWVDVIWVSPDSGSSAIRYAKGSEREGQVMAVTAFIGIE